MGNAVSETLDGNKNHSTKVIRQYATQLTICLMKRRRLTHSLSSNSIIALPKSHTESQ